MGLDVFSKIVVLEEIMVCGVGGVVVGLGFIDIGLLLVVNWGSDELKCCVVVFVIVGEKI